MNRLIIVGNGFDLAHGLKTDYNSFILWYLKDCFTKAYTEVNYEDELISITFNGSWDDVPILGIRDVNGFIEYFYKKGFSQLQEKQLSYFYSIDYPNPFAIKFKSRLFMQVIRSCNYKKWVDIENAFYDHLKSCLNGGEPTERLKVLNKDLDLIIKKLKSYLANIPCINLSPEYSKILTSEIVAKDMVLSSEELYRTKLYNNEVASETMILNFNYTNTIEAYLKNHIDLPHITTNITLNYIHGEVTSSSNSPVFGFGDELDDDYKKMENANNNDFFKHIKSFSYFKTSNYHDLLRFIQTGRYQIYILGHSCGLSDRTMLNMIFEHPFCCSIKIYYHESEDGNNYTELTHEISRHFTDKIAMRRKIVSLNNSSNMPQVAQP